VRTERKKREDEKEEKEGREDSRVSNGGMIESCG
jgi:hypothetical protein